MEVTQNYLSILLASAEELSQSKSSKNIDLLKKLIKKKEKKKRQLLLRTIKIPRRKVIKNKNFEECIELMDDDIFYSHFRMQRSTFNVSTNV